MSFILSVENSFYHRNFNSGLSEKRKTEQSETDYVCGCVRRRGNYGQTTVHFHFNNMCNLNPSTLIFANHKLMAATTWF